MSEQKKVCFRAAREQDENTLYDIKKRALFTYVDATWGWNEAFQQQFFTEHFHPECIQVIEYLEHPIGMIEYQVSEDSFRLRNLLLVPNWQSKGIGTKIIQDIIAYTRANKKKLFVEVLKANERARIMAERMGFRVSGVDEHKLVLIL